MKLSLRQWPSFRLVASVISVALCVIVDVVALFCVVSAFAMSPDGPWDHGTLQGIEVAALIGGFVTITGAVLRILPVMKRWIRSW